MGVAQSQPVCPLNGQLYPRPSRTGPGPACLGRQAVWPQPLGSGQRPGLCQLRPRTLLAGKGTSPSEGLRLVQFPARRGPAFSGIRKDSPKSLATSSSLLVPPRAR